MCNQAKVFLTKYNVTEIVIKRKEIVLKSLEMSREVAWGRTVMPSRRSADLIHEGFHSSSD